MNNRSEDKFTNFLAVVIVLGEGILKYYTGFNEYVVFGLEQGFSYIAMMEDIPCGVLLAYEKPDVFEGTVLYVELLAVRPEDQRKGVATALLDTVKQAAQERGFVELSLRTGCYMDSYLVYRKYGFKDARDDQRYMVCNIRKKQKEE